MSRINILARWDATNVDCVTEWRMYRQLRGAFALDKFIFTPIESAHSGVAIEQYDTFEDALAAAPGVRVFLEPGGADTFADIPADQDVTFIVGNTENSNAAFIEVGDLSVSIASVNPTDLYGVNAVAIALAITHALK